MTAIELLERIFGRPRTERGRVIYRLFAAIVLVYASIMGFLALTHAWHVYGEDYPNHATTLGNSQSWIATHGGWLGFKALALVLTVLGIGSAILGVLWLRRGIDEGIITPAIFVAACSGGMAYWILIHAVPMLLVGEP